MVIIITIIFFIKVNITMIIITTIIAIIIQTNITIITIIIEIIALVITQSLFYLKLSLKNYFLIQILPKINMEFQIYLSF